MLVYGSQEPWSGTETVSLGIRAHQLYWSIGHFRITFSLFFKASLGAHPFIWKWNLIPSLALIERLKVIQKWPILLFWEQIEPPWRHMSARIYAQVMGSRVDAGMLHATSFAGSGSEVDVAWSNGESCEILFQIFSQQWQEREQGEPRCLYVGRIAGRWNERAERKGLMQ